MGQGFWSITMVLWMMLTCTYSIQSYSSTSKGQPMMGFVGCTSSSSGRMMMRRGEEKKRIQTAFSQSNRNRVMSVSPPLSMMSPDHEEDQTLEDTTSSSNGKTGRRRRQGMVTRNDIWSSTFKVTAAAVAGLALGGSIEQATITTARAAEAEKATGPKQWISGKSEKPKGSKDRTGTKKDSSYLRCLSDCTTDCRKPGQGPSKDSAECLDQCQDYCCSTYEQCTYQLKRED